MDLGGCIVLDLGIEETYFKIIKVVHVKPTEHHTQWGKCKRKLMLLENKSP